MYTNVKGLSFLFMDFMDGDTVDTAINNISSTDSSEQAVIKQNIKILKGNWFIYQAQPNIHLDTYDNHVFPDVLTYPRPTYIPKSDYVQKGLPTMVSTTTLDLWMLLLDVYLKLPQETEVVQQTLKKNAHCNLLPYANPHVFLAGHAFGKTKSLLNIAQHRYTIYLDISASHHIDITDMKA